MSKVSKAGLPKAWCQFVATASRVDAVVGHSHWVPETLFTFQYASRKDIPVVAYCHMTGDLSWSIEFFKAATVVGGVSWQAVNEVKAVLRKAGLDENKVFFVEAATPSDLIPNPLNIEDVKSDSLICVVDSGIRSANGIFDDLVKDVFPVLPPKAVVPSARTSRRKPSLPVVTSLPTIKLVIFFMSIMFKN